MMNITTLFSHRLSSILLTTVALSTLSITAQAANMTIYKDKRGQVLLTNVAPSGNFDAYNKKVRETYYRSDNSSNTRNSNTSNSNAPKLWQ